MAISEYVNLPEKIRQLEMIRKQLAEDYIQYSCSMTDSELRDWVFEFEKVSDELEYLESVALYVFEHGDDL